LWIFKWWILFVSIIILSILAFSVCTALVISYPFAHPEVIGEFFGKIDNGYNNVIK